MASPRCSSIKEARAIIKALEFPYRESDLLELFKEQNLYLAQAMLEPMMLKKDLAKIQVTWVDELGNSISTPLFLRVLELAMSHMSYDEKMKMFLKHNNSKFLPEVMFNKLFLKQMNEQAFEAQAHKDEVYLPILCNINPRLAKQLGYDQPLPAAAKQYIEQEIKEHLGFTHSELTDEQKDIVAINYFLCNRELMLKQLQKFDKELSAKILEKNQKAKLPLQPVTQMNFSMFEKPYPKDEKSFLFEFFKNWAQANHFKDLTRLMKNLTNADFIQNLKNNILFKDPAFGGEFHGAWTHLLQWYCIVSAYQDGEITLHQSPAEIYQMIGRTADSENTVWDLNFEGGLISSISSMYDFRDVVRLNKYINHNPEFAELCPTTQAILYSRALHAEEKYSPDIKNNNIA